MSEFSFLNSFQAREDLKQYGDNALLLYALELKYNIDDIRAMAVQALTDGNNDKKCDLVYVDRDGGFAVIAQGYMARKVKREAPADKAADLNTAVSWLLSLDLELLPERIKPAAIELRDALDTGVIRSIELWYVHNCRESKNVKSELASAQMTASNAINTKYRDSNCNEVRATEIGLSTLDEWYKAANIVILVNGEFQLPIPGGYSMNSSDWEAFATAIPAQWLYELYRTHKTKLLSANVRDYLGSRKSDSNINYGIKQSATKEYGNFWAFNNGITAIVNDFDVDENILSITGISIVNGAQTTGAIGSLDNPPHADAMVPARFIKSKNRTVVRDVIRYNNSQNKIAPADFRSSDAIQDRLRKEFERHSFVTYLGGRRGGEDDVIRRIPNLISSDTAAQSLAAFHQRPVTAYNQKGNLWESDQEYSRIFNDGTHADHILFVYSLNLAVSNLKLVLMTKERNKEKLTKAEEETIEFLRYRGSIYILMAAIGSCMESILGEPIASDFLLRFKKIKEMSEAENIWRPIVECCIAFRSVLQKPLQKGVGLKNAKDVDDAISEFRSLFEATLVSNKKLYDEFAEKVIILPR
jgi:hypothetical protein